MLDYPRFTTLPAADNSQKSKLQLLTAPAYRMSELSHMTGHEADHMIAILPAFQPAFTSIPPPTNE